MENDDKKPADMTMTWYGLMAIGVVAASASGTIVKIAHQEHVPALVIAASRNYVACTVLLPFFLAGAWRELAGLSRREKALIAACGVILGLHFLMWTLSLKYTSVASATIFVTTTPVFVVLGSHYILREKVSPLIAIGIAISIMGGILVVGADLGRFYGDFLALLGAVGASAYMLIGRRIRPKLHLVSYTFVVYAIAAMTLTLLALAAGNSFTGYSPRAYRTMLLLGLIPSLIGHTLINLVLRHLQSYIVSIAMLGEPVIAALLAIIFLRPREVPDTLEVVGCVVMLAGIYLAIKLSSRK